MDADPQLRHHDRVPRRSARPPTMALPRALARRGRRLGAESRTDPERVEPQRRCGVWRRHVGDVGVHAVPESAGVDEAAV